MSQNVTKSVLFNTSASTDVQYSGGVMTFDGFPEIKIPVNRIVNFSQINYRAEVVQVVTVGGTSYTPTASTVYEVQIGDINRKSHGYTQYLKSYSYTTPADITTIGANAASQREYIHGKLVTKINADNSNFAVAASLGTGTGFTVTDDAGYYPYPHQGVSIRLGASQVFPITQANGTGFASTNVALTTAAVYAFGVGATLANFAPVVDYVTGNVISGSVDAPKTSAGAFATSGQKYNAFSISYLENTNIPTITGRESLRVSNVTVYADNGAGASTTNLAGYLAFAKNAHRAMKAIHASDPSAMVEMFDNVILFQGAAGAVPTATGENKMVADNTWVYTQIGSQTITVPTPNAAGLLLDQDAADTEGAEYTPSLLTGCPKEFTVGKGSFSVFARLKATDWTDAAWQVGFRRKAAHAADFNNYTDLASVGTLAANGDLVVTNGILNNAATVSTSTAIAPTDSAFLTVEVLVAVNGTVTCKLNDVTYPVYSVGTTALVLDAGDIMIPFVLYANISTGDPDLILNEVIVVPTAYWKA